METITSSILINASPEHVWAIWISPEHTANWNAIPGEWYTHSAVSDLRAGGKFSFVMKAADGSDSFDYGGTYDSVIPMQKITTVLDDGRRAAYYFEASGNAVIVTETYDPVAGLDIELQESFSEKVLLNFKKYAEGLL